MAPWPPLTWRRAVADVGGMQRSTVQVGTRFLDVALARTPTEWARGLVGQSRDFDGLLMVMPKNTRARFHMRQVPDPVLLALFDTEGHLIEVTLLEPETGEYQATFPFAWALELVGRHTTPEGILAILPDLTGGLQP